MLSILVFYLLAKKVYHTSSIIKALQFSFFPILFPFFFLVYTDVLSLLLVLCALYLVLSKKYDLAGAFGVLSMLVRQNNVMWLAFLCAFVFFQESKGKVNHKIVVAWIKKCWTFILGFILFIFFVIANKGVAFGNVEMHPSFSFYTGNIFFMLFLFFFLFLPLNLRNLPEIIKLIKNKKTIILIGAVFVIYIFTFVNNHPFNTGTEYFLRNWLLVFFTSNLALKIAFFLPVAYTLMSLTVTKMQNKIFYLLYALPDPILAD